MITETSVISNYNTSIAEVSFVDNEIFRNGGYMEETRTELQMIKIVGNTVKGSGMAVVSIYSIWKADIPALSQARHSLKNR